ncbi:MAG: hypothetical protein QXY10_03305 [Candidatus Micrarchaeaceae archaeon]
MAEQKSVLEEMQEKYKALPTEQRRTEFIKQWDEEIQVFNRLLWTCNNPEQYAKVNSDIRKIQDRLNAIVKVLSLTMYSGKSHAIYGWDESECGSII